MDRRKLVYLLAELGCSYEALHTAGNDTYFSLQAMLLLAATSVETDGSCLLDADHARAQLIREIGQAHFTSSSTYSPSVVIQSNKKGKRKPRRRNKPKRINKLKSPDSEDSSEENQDTEEANCCDGIDF